MELKALDLRFLSRGVEPTGGETVIATIDEKSISELGRWPWRRTVIAALVDRLHEYGAKAVGFDIVFAEPDDNSGLAEIAGISNELEKMGFQDSRIDEILENRKRNASTDSVLAQSIGNAGNVTLGYFFYTSGEEAAHLSDKDIEIGAENIAGSQYQAIRLLGEPDASFIPRAYAAAANIGPLAETAENAGYFNAFPDVDGTNRWSPLAIAFRDQLYPSLALAALMVYADWPLLAATISELGIEELVLGDTLIPTDEGGRMLINYRGPAGTFPFYSVTDIIHGRLDPALFENKIVLVGATATGIYDLRVTPFSPVYPGVEIHATVIDNILHKDFIKRPGWTAIFDILAVIILGFVLVPVLSRFRAVTGLLFALILALAYIVFNRFVFAGWNFWLNMVYPVLTILFVYVGITIYKYVTEEREKKKIRGAFQYYLTASVINEMLKNPSKLKLGGDKKDLTVLFSDIRGFTTVSEKLTPEELVKLLNEYLTAMTDKVFQYDGLLDKYMGDAIMAVYGAPLDQPDHAIRACRTALDMMKELKNLQVKWSREGRPVLNIGIGINSGDMVVGNMGSQMRFDYTVMGDSVNLGSRLEGINKEYGTNIVISEFTYEAVKEVFLCRELDAVRVKGKILPVKIFELRGPRNGDGTEIEFVRIFEEGLSNYRQCLWDDAVACFRKVLEIKSDDYASEMYIKRCEELRTAPPESGWDGVFTMTKK
jgi:adenylate cyclase